jgi:hypothetical protein
MKTSATPHPPPADASGACFNPASKIPCESRCAARGCAVSFAVVRSSGSVLGGLGELSAAPENYGRHGRNRRHAKTADDQCEIRDLLQFSFASAYLLATRALPAALIPLQLEARPGRLTQVCGDRDRSDGARRALRVPSSERNP